MWAVMQPTPVLRGFTGYGGKNCSEHETLNLKGPLKDGAKIQTEARFTTSLFFFVVFFPRRTLCLQT